MYSFALTAQGSHGILPSGGSTMTGRLSLTVLTSLHPSSLGRPPPRGAGGRLTVTGAGVSSARPQSPGFHIPWMSGWPSGVRGGLHGLSAVPGAADAAGRSCAGAEKPAGTRIATVVTNAAPGT